MPKKNVQIEDTIIESPVVAAHDAIITGVDLMMLDEFDARFSAASGEDNPRYNAGAHFMFGSRAKSSAKQIVKKRDRVNEVQHQMQTEEENNGKDSSKYKNIALSLHKAEAELATAQHLHYIDVMVYNTIMEHRAWNDGRVTEDHGEAWYEGICDQIMNRKVLSPQQPKQSDIEAKRAAMLKRTA